MVQAQVAAAFLVLLLCSVIKCLVVDNIDTSPGQNIKLDLKATWELYMLENPSLKETCDNQEYSLSVHPDSPYPSYGYSAITHYKKEREGLLVQYKVPNLGSGKYLLKMWFHCSNKEKKKMINLAMLNINAVEFLDVSEEETLFYDKEKISKIPVSIRLHHYELLNVKKVFLAVRKMPNLTRQNQFSLEDDIRKRIVDPLKDNLDQMILPLQMFPREDEYFINGAFRYLIDFKVDPRIYERIHGTYYYFIAFAVLPNPDKPNENELTYIPIGKSSIFQLLPNSAIKEDFIKAHYAPKFIEALRPVPAIFWSSGGLNVVKKRGFYFPTAESVLNRSLFYNINWDGAFYHPALKEQNKEYHLILYPKCQIGIALDRRFRFVIQNFRTGGATVQIPAAAGSGIYCFAFVAYEIGQRNGSNKIPPSVMFYSPLFSVSGATVILPQTTTRYYLNSSEENRIEFIVDRDMNITSFTISYWIDSVVDDCLQCEEPGLLRIGSFHANFDGKILEARAQTRFAFKLDIRNLMPAFDFMKVFQVRVEVEEKTPVIEEKDFIHTPYGIIKETFTSRYTLFVSSKHSIIATRDAVRLKDGQSSPAPAPILTFSKDFVHIKPYYTFCFLPPVGFIVISPKVCCNIDLNCIDVSNSCPFFDNCGRTDLNLDSTDLTTITPEQFLQYFRDYDGTYEIFIANEQRKKEERKAERLRKAEELKNRTLAT